MEVILAGHNLDRELIVALGRLAGRAGGEAEIDAQAAGEPPLAPEASIPPTAGEPPLDPEALTPETLSAAYARISRDPRPIPELRAEARRDVARARRSNRQIVFGFGHASVAEHAVFNFDVLGISRLATEALEASRLGSYTEKSQRYILLERDAIVPAEIAGTALEAAFRELLEAQQNGYRQAYDRLSAHHAQAQPEAWADPQGRRDLEGAAKEDARYFLGLATTGQLGATLNARTLEATVRRLAADPLAEVRELGERLHAAVAPIAPSLLRHTSASPYRSETPAALRDRLREVCRGMEEAGANAGGPSASPASPARPAGTGRPAQAIPRAEPGAAPAPVRLIDSTDEGETRLLAALIHGCAQLSWDEALHRAGSLDPHAREALIGESLRRLSPHDAPLRTFELPDFTFELVTSASCFAQLKRHRLATLLPQPYRPELGVTVPPTFREVGLEGALAQVCAQAESVHARIYATHPAAAAYALTNGHCRRLLFKANARELYHFARLRLDRHAQWDIRALAQEMIRQARERFPLIMMFAMGKDEFSQAAE